MTSLTHIVGTDVRIGSRRRQRCLWCGTLLEDVDLSRIMVPADQPGAPPIWEPGSLVRVDGSLLVSVPHEDGAELPQDSCARLDNEVTV